MPPKDPHSHKPRPKHFSEGGLKDRLRETLLSTSPEPIVKGITGLDGEEEIKVTTEEKSMPKEDLELEDGTSKGTEEEKDLVMESFRKMRKEEEKVQLTPDAVIEQSLFDFVVEMERQFDSIQEDLDEIRKQELRRRIVKVHSS